MEFRTMKLAELKPAKYNPRKDLQPGDPDYEKIKRSIEHFGMVDPIVANKDGTIIGGHQRYKCLIDLGYEETEVSVVDLDEAGEMALNIALNETGGDWDMEKLKEVVGKIDLSGLDATLTGFDADELNALVGEVDVSGESLFDEQDEKDSPGKKACRCPACGFEFEIL